MAGAEFPLAVIPLSETPSVEVFRAFSDTGSYRRYPYSDIFPNDEPKCLEGMLGDYRSGGPKPNDPLFDLADSIKSNRQLIYGIEADNEWARTDETSRGLSATMLHSQLAGYISRAYKNLLNQGTQPAAAIETISLYIDAQHETRKAEYEQRAENGLAGLAEPLIRQAEVRLEDILNPKAPIGGNKPSHIANLEYVVSMAGLRLERLDFERRSADAIVKILRSEVLT